MPKGQKKRKAASVETVGERIKKLRLSRGLTQTELGKQIGVTQRVITYYEAAGGSPAPELLLKLAKTLSVSTDQLLGQTPQSDAKAQPGPSTLRLWRRLKKLEALPAHDQKSVLKMIDLLADQASRRKAS